MPPRPRPAARVSSCSAVAAADHLDWAAGVALAVAHAGRFRGAERDDLVSVAHLTLIELLARDPAGRPWRSTSGPAACPTSSGSSGTTSGPSPRGSGGGTARSGRSRPSRRS